MNRKLSIFSALASLLTVMAALIYFEFRSDSLKDTAVATPSSSESVRVPATKPELASGQTVSSSIQSVKNNVALDKTFFAAQEYSKSSNLSAFYERMKILPDVGGAYYADRAREECSAPRYLSLADAQQLIAKWTVANDPQLAQKTKAAEFTANRCQGFINAGANPSEQ